jgi:hypothetical protein
MDHQGAEAMSSFDLKSRALAPFRAFPGLSEHRAPLGRLDLLAAIAINIRPRWGQAEIGRDCYKHPPPMGAGGCWPRLL